MGERLILGASRPISGVLPDSPTQTDHRSPRRMTSAFGASVTTKRTTITASVGEPSRGDSRGPEGFLSCSPWPASRVVFGWRPT